MSRLVCRLNALDLITGIVISLFTKKKVIMESRLIESSRNNALQISSSTRRPAAGNLRRGYFPVIGRFLSFKCRFFLGSLPACGDIAWMLKAAEGLTRMYVRLFNNLVSFMIVQKTIALHWRLHIQIQPCTTDSKAEQAGCCEQYSTE
jgi:hypothetical protein